LFIRGAVKVNKERKIYLGLLALGVVALGIDRMTRGGAAAEPPANADPPVVVTHAVAVQPAVAKTGGPADKPTSAALPVSALLRRAAATRPASDKGVVDVFRVSRRWPGSVPPTPQTPAAAATFEGAHQLTGLFLSEGRRRAIIDGRTLAIGERLDGYTLLSVEKNSAVLASKQTRVVLTLVDLKTVAGADR
jgi:hypothetical protein